MKKTAFWALAASLCLLGSAACTRGNGNTYNRALDDDQVYTGILPAADCQGIRYTLSLDYDDDNNYTDGDFKLVQTYINGDSIAPSGIKDVLSEKSKGDFRVTDNNNVKALTLTTKRGNAGTMYFVQTNDSTLTMTNSNFDIPATPGYTLKLVK